MKQKIRDFYENTLNIKSAKQALRSMGIPITEREIMKNLADIFNRFFEDDTYRHYFVPEQFMKVQAKGKSLIKKGESRIDLFDEALENCVLYLKKEFDQYKQSSLYKEARDLFDTYKRYFDNQK